MYHSVRFSKNGTVKNSWSDWYLVPTSRPVINPPEPKFNTVDIPGANGSIDLTEVVSGDVVYQNRTGSFEFIVMNTGTGHMEKPMEWFDLYSDIMDYLHGQIVQVSLEDEIPAGETVPTYYYEGRCEVTGWTSDENYSTIEIDYDLFPYKYATKATTDVVSVSSVIAERTYTTGRMPIIPKFTASNSDSQILWKGKWLDLSKGENAFANVQFTEGRNAVSFKGTGTVTVTYREGRL